MQTKFYKKRETLGIILFPPIFFIVLYLASMLGIIPINLRNEFGMYTILYVFAQLIALAVSFMFSKKRKKWF